MCLVRRACGAKLAHAAFELSLSQKAENAADLILLNVLWLVCCIPVFTIGPSTTAMCCVTRGMAKGDWPPVIKTFFREFRNNFRQGLSVFLALLIPVGLVCFYLLITVSGGLDSTPFLKYLSYVAVMFIGFVCSYAYPLLATFDNTVGNTLKNAVLLPLANPILAVIVTGLNLLPLILYLVNELLLFRWGLFWIFIGNALTSYINMRLLGKFFQRLLPVENSDE